MNNSISHFAVYVITYPFWDLNGIMLVKGL